MSRRQDCNELRALIVKAVAELPGHEVIARGLATELNWRPLDDASSLYALATHTIGNVRHSFLNVLCGLPVTRHRDAEFMVSGGSAAEIDARWNELTVQISDAIEELPATELDRERDHPRRGSISGRELLIVVARHAAEHYGQAQLTRDLVRARRSG